ncbi:hypothetical protein WICPIJ_005152 [Wickerhamomyces pijperi]|uniref:RRM domain-containing protein n=1 Tax=Wickerhamomyces pijperi TaxID=599730 RepID=A0A9P8TM74_WICPI|nr:hypothetical protein WICPIJ_005152 [Wickerhamomyces pijperi]
MSDALEKSLDEIIGESQDSKRSNRSFNRGSSRGSNRDTRGPRSYRSDRRDDRDRPPRRRSPRRNGGGDRDLFRDRDSSEREFRPRQTKIQRLSRGKPYLKISNLNYEITGEMLRQLLETIGPVSFLEMDFDERDHRPTGIAFAGFEDYEADNRRCIREFDGKPAVGRVIDVEEIKPLLVIGRPSSASSGSSRGPRSRGDLYIPNGPKSDRPPRGPRRGRVNAEDLDKELEEYMNRSADKDTTNTTESSGVQADISNEDKMEE